MLDGAPINNDMMALKMKPKYKQNTNIQKIGLGRHGVLKAVLADVLGSQFW
jgi:hypothetical protein